MENENAKNTGSLVRKLYINIDSTPKDSVSVSVKDNYGKLLESHSEPRGSKRNTEYLAVVKALEIAAKHCRGKVYIFSNNRILVNHANGLYRIRNPDVLRSLINMKSLEPIFESVKYFHVENEEAPKTKSIEFRIRSDNISVAD